jgi:histidine triad (HIT) family protein
MSCVFCEIVAGNEPATIRYEDTDLLVIDNKYPKFQQHYLVIPKMHIENLRDISDEKKKRICDHLMTNVTNFASLCGLHDFKMIIHCGVKGGQEIQHLHIHLACDEK